VLGSTVFLIPAMALVMQLLSPRRQRLQSQRILAAHR
jgi:hypothetical protein